MLKITCRLSGILLLAIASTAWAQETPPPPAPEVAKTAPAEAANALLPGEYTVYAFGAKGDGATDDTQAFQDALNAAGKTGGVVKAGAGRFLIKGRLVFPENVTLEGLWRAPARGLPIEGGTVLLTTIGKGEADSEPFITLKSSAVLKGVTIFHPEQTQTNPPLAYPWTVRGEGDNNTVINVTMINPYQAVDFGTKFCGRHYIDGLYAQALYRGVLIDQCYDVGRIENVHFWPFWTGADKGPLFDFTYQNGIAFTFARTDGEMGVNLFQIFYKVGFLFTDRGFGGGSGMYTNLYSDVSPCAVRVEASHQHAPISIVNGSLMTAVEVAAKKQTVVSLVGTGFWTVKETTSHLKLEGPATVLVSGCRFYDWDKKREGAAAIEANCESLTVTGSEFFMKRPGATKVRLGKDVASAVITGNRMRGGVEIETKDAANADLQIGLNSGK